MSVSTACLVVGHVLAVPFSLWVPGFLRLWRRRERAVFAAEELGTALICAGWAAKGRGAAVAVNSAWGVGLAVLWVLEGRKRARDGTSGGAS